MNLSKNINFNYEPIIRECWTADPEIQKFSRNSEYSLEDRLSKEIDLLKNTTFPFLFYTIYDDGKFVGYFGQEFNPDFLTTIFIMPKYRQNKKEIWDFIMDEFPDQFLSGLFAVNIRAISFYKKMGGVIINKTTYEDKEVVIFEFKR